MTQLFTNNAESTSATDHASGSTTLALVDAGNFAAPTSGDYQEVTIFYDDGSTEIVKSIAKAGNLLTLESGTSQPVPSGTPVEATLTSGGIDNLRTLLKGSNEQTTTPYTLALSDAGLLVVMNNASTNVVTVPAESSVDFPLFTQIHIYQKGAGQTNVAADTGVTIRSSATLRAKQQYALMALIKVGADEWLLTGEREV